MKKIIAISLCSLLMLQPLFAQSAIDKNAVCQKQNEVLQVLNELEAAGLVKILEDKPTGIKIVKYTKKGEVLLAKVEQENFVNTPMEKPKPQYAMCCGGEGASWGNTFASLGVVAGGIVLVSSLVKATGNVSKSGKMSTINEFAPISGAMLGVIILSLGLGYCADHFGEQSDNTTPDVKEEKEVDRTRVSHTPWTIINYHSKLANGIVQDKKALVALDKFISDSNRMLEYSKGL